MVESLSTSTSFMKEARARYRMPGGRVIGATMLLLLASLIALVLRADVAILGTVSPKRTVLLALVDLLLMLALMVVVVQHRARILWKRAHDGVIGTRLQTRIILMFTGIAIVPTLIVTTFSILFFNAGMRSWFDHQVSAALEDSVAIATAYVEEHKESIRVAAASMGDVIHDQHTSIINNPSSFTESLSMNAAARNLSEAVIFNRERVFARTALSFSLTFERLGENVLGRADNGEIVVFRDDQDSDKIQAVAKISRAPDLYLLVSRRVDPTVLKHMETARETVDEYQQLQADLVALQRQFFVVFVLVALLVLLASLWAGILLAVRLIEPLRALMVATEHVRVGDYSVRVPEGRADDEIANLGRTFNRMTGQLEAQRHDLMEANRLIDERRRFTEAVLLGVSAGIIALDAHGRVTLHNVSARELLQLADIPIGTPLSSLLPEAVALMQQAQQNPERVASGEITVMQGERRTILHVQVTAERFGDCVENFIVTFDDITALIAAQRSAAWADVARRIAHEIKNPLTPITLSAERLRKKFLPREGTEERDSFERYLETIARHTRDIGKMVEEFVAYARMPQTVFREENLVSIVRKAVFSEQTAHADIKYMQSLPEGELRMVCDESQLGRVILNLLKNAAEAMEGREGSEISLTLTREVGKAILTIEDNGPGFPPDKIDTLTEPYVTTRVKGTGLGLAIVKRSIEEHKGTLALSNRESGGAKVTIILPLA